MDLPCYLKQANILNKQKKTLKTLKNQETKVDDSWKMRPKEDEPNDCPNLLAGETLQASVQETGAQSKKTKNKIKTTPENSEFRR